LPCLIVRNRLGALCGYVGVEKDSKLYGKHYSDIDSDFGVHGGLTFSNKCDSTACESEGICHKPDAGESDDVWWLGFDCSHSGDLIPYRGFIGESYRNVAYVKSQCASLAKQIKEAE